MKAKSWRSERRFPLRCTLPALLGLGICLVAGDFFRTEAQEAGQAKADAGKSDPTAPIGNAAARTKRLQYQARFAKPAELAPVLNRFFNGDADFVVVEPESNTLLVNSTPAAYDEVQKTLALLDRKPRAVAIEVVTVELPAAVEKDAPPGTPRAAWDTREFTGPIERVNEKLTELSKAGRIVSLKRVRAEASENRQSQIQSGGEVSLVGNYTMNTQTGIANPIIQRRSVGTILMVTPRVTSETDLLLEVTIRDDRIFTPDEPFVLGKGADGPLISPEVLTSNLITKLAMKSGQAVVAEGIQDDAKSRNVRFVVILMAKLDEPAEKKQP